LHEVKRFSPKLLKEIIKEIVEAINFLHNNNIIYRDLKPSNILVRSKNPVELILTDFGISSILPNEASLKVTSGALTIAYSAPEAITGSKIAITKKVDYWSLGIIIIELLTGKHPFEGFDNEAIRLFLATKPVPIPDEINEDFKLCIKGLLTRDFDKRWGYNEIKEWLNGKRDIPAYYETEASIKEQKKAVNPFILYSSKEEKEFYTPTEVVKYAIMGNKEWQEIKKILMRGQFSTWITNEIKDYGLSTLIDEIRDNQKDSDLALFEIIYRIDNSLPFVFKGKLLATRTPKWNTDNLVAYLQKFYENVENQEYKEIASYICEKRLFSRYLKLINDVDHIKFIEQIEKRVASISDLDNKALTYTLALTNEDKKFTEKIKKNLSVKVYPVVEDFITAKKIVDGELVPDGKLLLKILDFTEKRGYQVEDLTKLFSSPEFEVAIRKIYRGEAMANLLVEDILYHQLLLQYLSKIGASREVINKVTEIESFINKFNDIKKRAFLFYMLLLNKKEEIISDILEKYEGKMICDAYLSEVLEYLRNNKWNNTLNNALEKFLKLLKYKNKIQYIWQKTYGGSGDDWANSIQQTSDGGYIVAGGTTSFGAGRRNVYIIKLDEDGNKIWEKIYGGSGDDWANSIQQTSDGGYIVAGGTTSFGAGEKNVYVIKLDAYGNKIWEKTFGGWSNDIAYSIQQTKDGGYIVAGWIESLRAGGRNRKWNVYIIKLDAYGNKIWEKTFGGRSHAGAYSIQQTKDGGYIVAGWTYSFGAGEKNVYIVKLNKNGNKVWEKTFGGWSNDVAYSIQQTKDGGYIVAGWTESFGAGGSDVYIIKLDAYGNKIWEKTFGGSGDDWANSIQQTSDGGYIVAGGTTSFGAGRRDVYVIKLDAYGNKIWEKTFGGWSNDIAYSIQQTKDGGYIVAGWTESFGAGGSDVYIIKLDEDGNTGPYPK
jgi:serine/threonine protein kinase